MREREREKEREKEGDKKLDVLQLVQSSLGVAGETNMNSITFI